MTQVAAIGGTVYPKPVHPKAHITFRHHVVPPLMGLLLFAGVLGLSNVQWLIAQANYRFYSSESKSLLASTPPKPDKSSVELRIPKINVDAPIQYEPSTAEWKVQLALRNGPDHYGATALPGQIGNTVILGHSSGQPWAPGNYKWVFTLLDKMSVGDKIYLDYQGTRYIYRVSETKIVEPSDMSVLGKSAVPQLSLITCTPVGTSKHRLVVIAKQVYPDPSSATPMTDSTKVRQAGSLLPN